MSSDNLWYSWYEELAKVLYGYTGIPSHKQVMEDFTLLRTLLVESCNEMTDIAMRYRLQLGTVADLVKRATPILRAGDQEIECPECRGSVWRTRSYLDAQHEPGCTSKPSWVDLTGEEFTGEATDGGANGR